MSAQANNNDDEDDAVSSSSGESDEDYVEVTNEWNTKNSNFLFTNGLGCSVENRSNLKTIVESAASKKEIVSAHEPEPELFCLVYRWARKAPYHFAADVINSLAVVAHELGLSSPFDLCNLRGWLLTRRSDKQDKFHIEYKRLQVCLNQANFPPGHKALNIKGVIEAVYKRLKTAVFPSAFPSGTIDARWESIKTKKNGTPANQRRSVQASTEFELIYAHDPSSFGQRLALNAKCLQVALFLMDFLFVDRVESKASRTKFYFSMFKFCYTSRKFVEMCHGLFVLFPGLVPARQRIG
jgi:hypothetical protein